MSQADFIAIHPLHHAHLPELVDLWISAWSKTMPEIDFEGRRVWFCDHFSALRDEGALVWCTFDTRNGTMAGFITLSPENGFIDQLAVAPLYWGTGAARVLLEMAKRHVGSQGLLRLTLEVNQSNARAIGFYEREGFQRVGAGVNSNSGRATWRCEWRA